MYGVGGCLGVLELSYGQQRFFIIHGGHAGDIECENECHFLAPYGFVIVGDCPIHDSKKVVKVMLEWYGKNCLTGEEGFQSFNRSYPNYDYALNVLSTIKHEEKN